VNNAITQIRIYLMNSSIILVNVAAPLARLLKLKV